MDDKMDVKIQDTKLFCLCVYKRVHFYNFTARAIYSRAFRAGLVGSREVTWVLAGIFCLPTSEREPTAFSATAPGGYNGEKR